MESVRHVALELLECERVTLFLINESRQELRCALANTEQPDSQETAAAFCTCARGRCLLRVLLRAPHTPGHSVHSTDAWSRSSDRALVVVLRLSICRGNTGPADEGRTITVKFGEGIAGVVAQNGTLAAAGSKQKRLLRVPAAQVSKVHRVTAAGPTAIAQLRPACAAAAAVVTRVQAG